MKPHRIDLHPRPASEFADTTAWQVMSIAEVDAELKHIERALGGATKQRHPDPDLGAVAWQALITSITAAHPHGELDAALADLAACTGRDPLLCRVAQARRALRYVASAVPVGASPTTTVLLPATWSARFDMLIGCGELPAAWLKRFDVTAF